MDSALLKIDNLKVTFQTPEGVVVAVNDVSFDLKKGEVLGIVGESGSGKSVTARAISGLLPDNAKISGSILFKGEQLVAFTEKQYQKIRGRDISMVFQNPSSHLDPLMTIGKHIREPLFFHKHMAGNEAQLEAVKRLEEVQISHAQERVDSFPHQLSGGMKQRAMIATAIACAPDLLIADEPTTALDVMVQAHILALLKSLNESTGLSIILISHDLAVVAQTCDRILVMRHGCVVEQGTVKEVLENPQHDYTKLLLNSHPNTMKRSSKTIGGTAEAPAEILSVENLSVEFELPGTRPWFGFKGSAKRFRALDKVSLSIHQGEIMGIVGESGSGKSTLAAAVIGLVEPLSGRVIRSTLLSDAQSVQMVFQNPFDSLNPRMTVADIVSEPLRIHRLVNPEQVNTRLHGLLKLVKFDPAMATKKPHQLSGGQCQRVGIARALAMNPKLLIADEITSALDVTIQAQIIELLEELKNTMGLTIMFISHDLNLVQSFCDSVCVFQAGQLIETGAAATVMAYPKTEYSRNLIASVPRVSLT
jgi:peptide/nickel transport system ATP-binding protein